MRHENHVENCAQPGVDQRLLFEDILCCPQGPAAVQRPDQRAFFDDRRLTTFTRKPSGPNEARTSALMRC
jgi:hypothetical protein